VDALRAYGSRAHGRKTANGDRRHETVTAFLSLRGLTSPRAIESYNAVSDSTILIAIGVRCA
jgi:hypothetical protein